MNRSGCLYVVATPIGNLGDISKRAVEILGAVDIIACEDTRKSGRLLAHLGVNTPMISYHEHNENDRSIELLKKIRDGEDIALISDAGTPLMSDPGYRLVSLCRKEDVIVHAVPGPCAGVAAMSVSGLPTDRFLFAGFLPKGKSAQGRALEEIRDVSATILFYIPVHSAVGQIRLIIEKLGDRQAFLIREMTKLYETSCSGLLSEILEQLAESPLKGEITLAVSGGEQKETLQIPESIDFHAYLYGLINFKGLSGKEAVQQCVRELNQPRKKMYQASLDLKRIKGEQETLD
ncbi:MAG: 16S rRNA (cytidine(1402)-2'-O)-methyltransferase [Anaerolineales bacterium]|nr:16S rRNA (cytidine(1402)-2'-O)-methyltransferase [Anaerolineales bacterium]